jgi:hypothetical protein
MHLLIPAAHTSSEALQQALRLPHLEQLLRRLKATQRLDAGEFSWSMPCEMALASELGLPAEAGRIPWAAYETRTLGAPCAFILPCHWDVRADHIRLSAPEVLALTETASRAVMEAMAPYFAEDGIALSYHQPHAWLATGEVFRNVPCASIARVIGRSIDAWMPAASAPEGGLLRRLQNEMQMLLYTHPLNDARAEAGLLPVNSFWVTGAGVLEQLPAPRPDVLVENRLSAPALAQDAPAYTRAWAEVDNSSVQQLLRAQQRGESVQLTLCGERAAQTWSNTDMGLWQKFINVLGLQPANNMREQL